jgi:membrane protease YdiL (CAAX protease family)
LTFLGLTILFTAGPWALIISTGDIAGGGLGYVYAMMWGPGLAAIATIKLKKLDIGILGLGWGNSKFPLYGYLIPIAYTLIAYLIIWTTGLGGFPNIEGVRTIAARLGWTTTDPAIFIPLFVLFTGTTGMLVALATGLGEEIGWRGFMAPQLAQRMGYTKAGIVGSAIWAAWHLPIILFADYNSGTPVWYALSCFTALVVGVGFIMQWLRLVSGSVWPAAIMHGAHNLFIQVIFTPLTVQYDITPYAHGEFGFVLPIIIGGVALFLWTKRDHAMATMKERIERTGKP